MEGEKKGKGHLVASFHSGLGHGLHVYGMVAACVWHVTCVKKVHVRGSALRSTSARSVSATCFLLLLSATVVRLGCSEPLTAMPCLACAVCYAASFLRLLPDSPTPPHAPQCTSSQESARRRSLLATAIMSVWLWSIAVTGGLTAGTCPMSSIVVRSCWELQRAPDGLPRAGLQQRLI